MLETLKPEQVAFYRNQGYLVLENRIPISIIENIRSEIFRFEEEAKQLIDPGVVEINIKLKWYAWLCFGLMHYSIKKEVSSILSKYGPACVIFKINVK